MKNVTNFMAKSAVVLFLFLASKMSFAQSKTDLVNWITSQRGIETLAVAAHPSDGPNYVSYNIISTSSTQVVIRITYPGFFGNYWDEYTISIDTYDGKAYFSHMSFREQKPDPITGPCQNCRTPSPYRVSNHYYAGPEDLWGTPLNDGDKCCFKLTDTFLDYWQN